MSDQRAMEDNRYPFLADDDGGDDIIDGDDERNSVFMMFPNSNISVTFKPKWSDVMAWKNELRDSALDETSSDDEKQVSHPI